MTAINSETRIFWQSIADNTATNRPSVGKTVKVLSGKHKDKEGKVLKHQIDKYNNPFRYGDSAQHAMREIEGRYGYVCLVEHLDKTTFWVKADLVQVLEVNPNEQELKNKYINKVFKSICDKIVEIQATIKPGDLETFRKEGDLLMFRHQLSNPDYAMNADQRLQILLEVAEKAKNYLKQM